MAPRSEKPPLGQSGQPVQEAPRWSGRRGRDIAHPPAPGPPPVRRKLRCCHLGGHSDTTVGQTQPASVDPLRGPRYSVLSRRPPTTRPPNCDSSGHAMMPTKIGPGNTSGLKSFAFNAASTPLNAACVNSSTATREPTSSATTTPQPDTTKARTLQASATTADLSTTPRNAKSQLPRDNTRNESAASGL